MTYKKSKTKLVKLRNQLKFLRRCRDNGFIPRGLRIKLSKDEIQVRNVSRMNYRLESVRVSSAIKNIRRLKIFSVSRQTGDIYLQN